MPSVSELRNAYSGASTIGPTNYQGYSGNQSWSRDRKPIVGSLGFNSNMGQRGPDSFNRMGPKPDYSSQGRSFGRGGRMRRTRRKRGGDPTKQHTTIIKSGGSRRRHRRTSRRSRRRK